MKNSKIQMHQVLMVFYACLFLPALSVHAWPVPDTGQTQCYCYSAPGEIPCPLPGEPFYGQDANYHINPMSFTKLDDNGEDLPESASSWVVVRDNVTGLIWEVKVDKDGVQNYNNPNDADNKYSWYDPNPETNGGNEGASKDGMDTVDFIDALNEKKLGGYSDWRIPSLREIDSIMDLSIHYPGPLVNTIYFPNTQTTFYCSSTTYIGYNRCAWGMLFNSGESNNGYASKFNKWYFRAVRGSQAQPEFLNNFDGTVLDKSTGLLWQQTTAPEVHNWQDALAYCENLALGGRFDWRLPTSKELRSIVDGNRYEPSIDVSFFPDTISDKYWASTNGGRTIDSFFVDFAYGQTKDYSKSAKYRVRAVCNGQLESADNYTIAQTPMSGPPGTTFVQWGTGFTPNSTATLHFQKPDGTEYPTEAQPIDSIGHFEITYTAPYEKPSGTYIWWAVDGVTGQRSNAVTYEVAGAASGLVVTLINPQADDNFFHDFFPDPDAAALVSGGFLSDTLAADGQSRLLLRFISDSPCPVTINGPANTSRHGGLTALESHMHGAVQSSLDIVLAPRNGLYVGYAVFHAPNDFNIPDYETKLTRSVTLRVESPCGTMEDIDITLRRPPIFISHGLWSRPDKIADFPNDLWARFAPGDGEAMGDYIGLNDCRPENAKAVHTGAAKTRCNIQKFLKDLRTKGHTVTRVDYLGHSMGGQWGRLVAQLYGKDDLTYDQGYLHKLVTLNTPHTGSYVADIGQFILDNGQYIPVVAGNLVSLSDFLCLASAAINRPVCKGAIADLTGSGSAQNLKSVSVPSHALCGNIVMDSACGLLEVGTMVGTPETKAIGTLLKVSERLLKQINPDYGCENWINRFDVSLKTDYVVGLDSQKGGLTDERITVEEYWHSGAFNDDIGNRFFDLLNQWPNEVYFASGFPAAESVRNVRVPAGFKAGDGLPKLLERKTPPGEIQFVSPADGAIVLPDDSVTVELSLTGTLTLNNVLIIANGSDAIELSYTPYLTDIAIPADAHDSFDIIALGEGTDGSLYSASVSLAVNSPALLEEVRISPEAMFLNVGEVMQLSVAGRYSDGSVREMNTAARGTVYTSGDESLMTVSEDGRVTAHTAGIGFLQVVPSEQTPVTVRVEIREPYLEAGFSATPRIGNPNLTVVFTDLSAGYVTGWEWDFGDGGTGSEQHPVHAYTTAGVYTVSQTVTGGAASDTAVKTDFIRVYEKGDINGDFQVDLADVITGLQVAAGIMPDVAPMTADVNGDGKFGMADVLYIIEQIAGIEKHAE